MKQLKRCLALALAFAVCVTMIPERAFAMELSGEAGEDADTLGENIASETEEIEKENGLESETVELSEEKNGTDTDIPAEGMISEEESKEDLYAAAKATEAFTVLTEGQELHHTDTGLKYYRFKPEENGFYHFAVKSMKAGDTFSANISKAIHSEGEKTYLYSSFQQISQVEKADRIMWLNSEETYEFYCWPEKYTDSTNLDISLMMKKVEITSVEAVTAPTASSSERFDGTGMEVKINFTDGTNVSSDVIYNTNGNNCIVLALDWDNVAYKVNESLSKYLTVLSVNGITVDYSVMPPVDEYSIISKLEEGEYPIQLGLSHYVSGVTETNYYEFGTTFQVDHNSITEMEVTPEKETYTEKFAQSLADISMKVTYEDGTTETVRTNDYSSGSYVYQYLSYGEYDAPDGTKQPYTTNAIDTYLSGGGTVGEAEVTVEYKGQKQTYKITILENPYSGISRIEPKRTIYYAKTSYKDTEHHASYSGDSITTSNVGKVTLSCKGGAEDVSYGSLIYMPGYSKYDASSYVKYGIKTNGSSTYYKDIEAYLSEGGMTGTNQVTVNYIDNLEKTYDIDIRENPYERIEIAQEPTKKEYGYSNRSNSLALNGLVIHAYKQDETYDTFTYGEDNTSALGLEWSDYLHAYSDEYIGKNSYGGDSDFFCNYPGAHTAYVVFMGLQATYEVQVAEEVVEEPTVMTELDILKNPARNVFYLNEKDYTSASTEDLLASGLEIQLKDSKGGVEKYKYGQNYSDGSFSQWTSYNIGLDTTKIDWTTPGTYQYTVYYRKNYEGKPEDVSEDLKKSLTITIADSPIETFTILREPQKKTSFAYERTTGFNQYLYGMAYQITFDDGSVYANTVRNRDTSSLSFTYRGNTYSARQSWTRKTSENYPALGENTLNFTVFGDTYSLEGFIFEEDPVTSIQFEKLPEKQIYMGNSYLESGIDLYGAELKIAYADESSETVQITEHGPSIVIGKYGKMATSKFNFRIPEDMGALGKNYVQVSYMGKTAEFFAEIDFDHLDASSVKTITDGGQTDVLVLDDENSYQVISFTPEKTGNYNFYCIDAEVKDMYTTSSLVVGLHEENGWMIPANTAGTWEFPCHYWGEMEAGKTYYYVVSMQGDASEARYQCYLSSEISDSSKLGGVKDIEIISSERNNRYDYELASPLPADAEPSVYGTHCKISYNNEHNWTEEKYITMRMPGVSIGSDMLMAGWKYKQKDEYGNEIPYLPEVRDDNEVIFTYGEKEIARFPAKIGGASPVESITINNNPWENTYEYKADDSMNGLSVTIHYTEESGKTDQTVVWDGSEHTYGQYRKVIDGYNMDAISSDSGTTDSDGVKIYYLTVNYMGKEAAKEISYAQNPITRFEVIDEPQKKVLYPFDEEADLYGMKFKVKFRDKTEQVVEVSEHGNSVVLPENSEEKVSGSIKTENGQKALYITSMGRRQKIMTYESAELPLDDTEKDSLAVSQTKYAVLDGDDYYKIYAFTAEEEGEYTFSVTGTVNRKLHLYSKEGEQLGTADSTLGRHELQRDMKEDETVYLVVNSTEVKYIGSIAATLKEKDIQKAEISDVNMAISDIPVGGSILPEVTLSDSNAGYTIGSYQWYGDEDKDGKADFATSHRLQVILVPDRQNEFTSDTNAVLTIASTGQTAEKTAQMLGTDGKLSLYYSFPHTECKIDFSQLDGYTLDTSGNAKADRVSYGEDYIFRYTNAAGEADSSLIVKANGNLVPLTNGSYTLEHVTDNVTVIVKSRNAAVGSDETLLALYNQSTDVCDIIVGKRNKTIQDNTNGENTLPVLPSYVNGSTDFFYGWYLDKDSSLNGKGTRFTSISKLLLDVYDLYAKWGSGFFTATLKGRTLGYQVLSFDEYNDMEVQVTGSGVRGRSVYALQSYDGETRDGIIMADDEILEIPASLKQGQIPLQDELELDIEQCTVVAIADNAFENSAEIKNVILPNTIERIGESAFANCTSLEEINIPKGVTEIGGHAFAGCTALEEIVIPSTVTSLGEGTFRGCQDLTIVLPDTMSEIDKDAFEDVTNVTIICSSELAGTDIIEAVKGSEVTVRTLDITLSNGSGNKTFTYGDEAATFFASVKVDGLEAVNRSVEWNVTDTDAFVCTVDGNSITVAPKRVTRDTEEVFITAVDKATQLEKSIALRTDAADLSKKDENGEALYVIETASQVYSGTEICPNVVVKKNVEGGAILSASDYDVFYADNINAGTGQIVIKGKGNYVGNISQTFTIDKAEQRIIASDIVKSTADLIFALGAASNGGGKLSYTSSNPQVAEIDEYGMVRICGAGVTEIGIQADETRNYKASEIKTIKLTVTERKDIAPVVTPVKSDLKVTKTAYTVSLAEKAFALKATAKTVIQYQSSNEKVALVTVSGNVILKKCGKTVITIKTRDTQKEVTVIVVPNKANAGKLVSKKSGQLKVTWKKQKEAAGYIVEYSTDKKFKKKVLSKTIKSNGKTSVTLTKLKKGSKYYVRVKAYTKIGSAKVCGKASKVQSKKVKK